jgi:DNA-binding LacI/PurR family transcriptional regulator
VVRRIDGQPGTWIDPHIWKYSADVRTSESSLPRRRVTLADVAAQAGVSKSLASLVIRDAPGPSVASREAVQGAAAELGYRPDPTAKLLRQQRSRVLGLVFDPGDPFHADLLEAAYPVAEQRGYELLLGARVRTRGEDRAVDGLLRSRCEGLILLGSRAGNKQLRALGEQVPVMLVGRRGRDADVAGVLGADEKGAGLAVDMLTDLGHRRIRFVDGGRQPGAAERRRGYRTAMHRQGLVADIVPGDHTEDSGVRAAREIIHRDEPITAVLASNDRSAVGVLDTLVRAGVQVPDQISVVGYDDSRLARHTYVNLTTVAQDATEMARLAVDTIAQRLDSGQERRPQDVLLEPHLVIRGTSGAPPRGS